MIKILTITFSISFSIADTIANFFRGPGQFLRDILMSIDLTIAKLLFILYFLAIAYWVYNLPKSEVTMDDVKSGKEIDLRPFALFAMGSMIIIYLIF